MFLILSPSEAVFSLESANIYLSNLDEKAYWCPYPEGITEQEREIIDQSVDLGIIKVLEEVPVRKVNKELVLPEDRLGRILFSPIADVLDEIKRTQLPEICEQLMTLEKKGKNPEGSARSPILNALNERLVHLKGGVKETEFPDTVKAMNATTNLVDNIVITDEERLTIK